MRGVRYRTVVLPAPEGPTKATCWPGSAVKDTPCRVGRACAAASGYANTTSRNSTRPTGPGAACTGIAPGASLIAGTRSRNSKIRAKIAAEVCTSSETRMSPMSGISRRACTVVKATIVPAVMTSLPPVIRYPATR